MGPEIILNLIKNEVEDWPLKLGKFSKWNHDWSLPKIQAHRGFHIDGIAENSMASLSSAKNKGFQMAEFDVQITKDGVPVVFHDFDLKRLLKINVSISELSYSDICRLGKFDRLKDVLASKDRPEFLNIEIKSKNLLRFPVEDAVVALLSEMNCVDKVIVSSFNPWALLRFKYLNSQITRALLVTDEPEIWNLYYLRRMWTVPLVEPHVLNIRHSMINSNLISRLMNFNVLTAAWTVNDLDLAKNLLSLGVSSIISDTLTPENLT